MKLRIRPARPDEREALEALQWRALLANPGDREVLLANPDAIVLPAEQLAARNVFVGEDDGLVLGFAVLLTGEQQADLNGLFVDPDHWRRGIGSALVNEAVHRARRLGLSLSVTAGAEAQAFYESCGFSVEGEAQTRFGPALRMTR